MNLLLECDNILNEQDKRLLRIADISRIGRILNDAGIELDYENIARYGNLSAGDVERLYKWNLSEKKGAKLGFTIGQQSAPKSDFAKLLAGILYIQRNKKPGIQNVEQITGLSAETITDLASQHFADIKREFQDFAMYWLRDASANARIDAKRQSPDQRRTLIRQAVMDIAKGKIGSVTAAQLAAWGNGAIGLGARQIDNYLSTDSSLRDLDKYRANGKHYKETDKDREQAYLKSKKA